VDRSSVLMGNLRLKAILAVDVLRNVCTGYYQKGKATSKDRSGERKRNCLDSVERVLRAVVGPGDLLSSSVRAEFAAEAYAAWGACEGCASAKVMKLPQQGENFATYNLKEIEHDFTTTSPFRDLAHAFVNRQQKLDETFFEAVLERMKQFHQDPTLGEDDFKAMAIELVLVAALCAGVRAFCAAAGIPAPPLPPAPQPSQPGRFRFVSDYSTSSLKTHRSIAWGPHLPSEQLRKEVVEAFHLDPSMISFGDSPAIPTSRASAAPLTCWEFLQWRDVMYVPIHDVLRFMKVPGTDRTLNRGQLEVAAADYTTAKACNF